MFLITFANLSFFELSEKFGVSVWEVLSHILRVTSLCLSGFEACFTDGSLCVDGLSFTVCFVSEVIPDLTYFFKTSRGRSARAPAHEAMSPLRSLAVSEGCLLHGWELGSPALAVNACRQPDRERNSECALIACYFNEVTILIPFKTFLVSVHRVTLVYMFCIVYCNKYIYIYIFF